MIVGSGYEGYERWTKEIPDTTNVDRQNDLGTHLGLMWEEVIYRKEGTILRHPEFLAM